MLHMSIFPLRKKVEYLPVAYILNSCPTGGNNLLAKAKSRSYIDYSAATGVMAATAIGQPTIIACPPIVVCHRELL